MEMTFVSELPLKTIEAKLNALDRLTYLNAFEEHRIPARTNKRTFLLWETGEGFSARPMMPFIGKLGERENSVVITGKFGPTRPFLMALVCHAELAWGLVLFLCFFNSNFTMSAKITMFAAVFLWTALLALLRYLPALFQRNQQTAVIGYIENTLL